MARDRDCDAPRLQPLPPALQHFPGLILKNINTYTQVSYFETNYTNVCVNVQTNKQTNKRTVLASSKTESSMVPVKSWCNMACRHSSSQQDALYIGMTILWAQKTQRKSTVNANIRSCEVLISQNNSHSGFYSKPVFSFSSAHSRWLCMAESQSVTHHIHCSPLLLLLLPSCRGACFIFCGAESLWWVHVHLWVPVPLPGESATDVGNDTTVSRRLTSIIGCNKCLKTTKVNRKDSLWRWAVTHEGCTWMKMSVNSHLLTVSHVKCFSVNKWRLLKSAVYILVTVKVTFLVKRVAQTHRWITAQYFRKQWAPDAHWLV